MLTYPGFNKVAFELGPIKVHWYGIMYLLGFAAAWWLARRRAAQPGSTWKKNDVDDVIFFAMLGVILGGGIRYLLFLCQGEPGCAAGSGRDTSGPQSPSKHLCRPLLG